MNEMIITINNRKHSVKINNGNEVIINNKKIHAEVSQINNNAYLLKLGNKVFEITAHKLNKDKYGVVIDGCYFEALVHTQLQERANELQKKKNISARKLNIKAPMPGLLLKLGKSIGDYVKVGEPLLILEAMKMENEIRSPVNGIVKEILFKEGQSVEKNSIIMTFE
ncbi:MAG: acetyl-CoA carboxylase biotin carboxyl carrier protein subunit [Ignavibacteriales bacterium]|nr:acetyl-CoA carboxylase biotin carboxyl carrier protein subunit [Ignavibacteriales bacterium]